MSNSSFRANSCGLVPWVFVGYPGAYASGLYGRGLLGLALSGRRGEICGKNPAQVGQ